MRGKLIHKFKQRFFLYFSCIASIFIIAAHANSFADVKQFDDWFYRCNAVASVEKNDVKQCEITQIQQVKNGDDLLNILSLAIALSAPEKPNDKPSLLLTSIVPLNVYLPDGIKYHIGGKEVAKIIFRNCNQSGCWAQQKLNPQFLAALKKANEAESHFRLLNGQNVTVKFSLKGFSGALEALEKR